VIPTRQQLQEIPQMRGGDLRQIPYPVLIYALALDQRSIVLELKRHQFEKRIIFEHGFLVDCRTNLAHETLGRFLLSQNKLPAEKLSPFLSESFSRQIPLGELLIEHGLLTPFELYKALQQNLASKLLDCFAWRDGEFALSLDVPPVDSPLKVRVPQLLITGVMRFAPQQEIDSAIVPLVGKTLGLHPDPPFPIEEIRLAPRHAKVLELLRQKGRIDQMAEASALSFEEITRLLYALAILGLAVPADQLPKESRPQPAPAAPKPAPVSSPPVSSATSPESIETVRNDVMRIYLDYRRRDPFELLGLAEDATPLMINAAFLAFARRFAPWQFEGDTELRALADKAEEMFLFATRAYALLSDPDQRRSLIHQRRARAAERQAPAEKRFVIKTDLLDPEVQYRKGLELMGAGKLREALTQFEFAADCDSQNGNYRAEAAYCRYLLSPFIPTGRKSLDELKEAIRIDAQCGLAHFYSGEIQRQLGERDAAEKSLRTAIKLMAPDRRPIEALKAMTK